MCRRRAPAVGAARLVSAAVAAVAAPGLGIDPDEVNIEQYAQWVRNHLQPYLPDLTFTDGATSVLVADIPASPTAPHLVYGTAARDKDQQAAVAPYRDRDHTAWMAERQLERAYRDRFTRPQGQASVATTEQAVGLIPLDPGLHHSHRSLFKTDVDLYLAELPPLGEAGAGGRVAGRVRARDPHRRRRGGAAYRVEPGARGVAGPRPAGIGAAVGCFRHDGDERAADVPGTTPDPVSSWRRCVVRRRHGSATSRGRTGSGWATGTGETRI
ncbi:hypothetical protein SHIRM173S_09737 [Streptomyces hirsutus]